MHPARYCWGVLLVSLAACAAPETTAPPPKLETSTPPPAPTVDGTPERSEGSVGPATTDSEGGSAGVLPARRPMRGAGTKLEIANTCDKDVTFHYGPRLGEAGKDAVLAPHMTTAIP